MKNSFEKKVKDAIGHIEYCDKNTPQDVRVKAEKQAKSLIKKAIIQRLFKLKEL